MAGVVVLVGAGDSYSVMTFSEATAFYTDDKELNVNKDLDLVATFAPNQWSAAYLTGALDGDEATETDEPSEKDANA